MNASGYSVGVFCSWTIERLVFEHLSLSEREKKMFPDLIIKSAHAQTGNYHD